LSIAFGYSDLKLLQSCFLIGN